MTPDSNFIIDKHPVWRNIIVGAGFSGKNFIIDKHLVCGNIVIGAGFLDKFNHIIFSKTLKTPLMCPLDT